MRVSTTPGVPSLALRRLLTPLPAPFVLAQRARAGATGHDVDRS